VYSCHRSETLEPAPAASVNGKRPGHEVLDPAGAPSALHRVDHRRRAGNTVAGWRRERTTPMIGGLPQRRGPRRVIGDREPASVFRRGFWLVGACGWKLGPGAPVQGPGQAFCPLRSLPALGFPGFSELGLTVPGSQPHVATDPNRTVDRADRGPLHRVELLQHMRGPCHGRIISSAKHPPARPVLLPWAGLDGCQEAVWASVLRAGWWQPPGGWTERWVSDRVPAAGSGR
jgi:hypothetical protein